eukprot:TRINITY_DN6952_c0_g1_i1.p1 TRINITY_DN6952_c0_g1~~TRINITY_DN6952_c0_g1_i1.p1  ORF type:complete len:570 (+),score=147.73 TRINITY_DN6952_c0_g1_i1:124-1833(+)
MQKFKTFDFENVQDLNVLKQFNVPEDESSSSEDDGISDNESLDDNSSQEEEKEDFYDHDRISIQKRFSLNYVDDDEFKEGKFNFETQWKEFKRLLDGCIAKSSGGKVVSICGSDALNRSLFIESAIHVSTWEHAQCLKEYQLSSSVIVPERKPFHMIKVDCSKLLVDDPIRHLTNEFIAVGGVSIDGIRDECGNVDTQRFAKAHFDALSELSRRHVCTVVYFEDFDCLKDSKAKNIMLYNFVDQMHTNLRFVLIFSQDAHLNVRSLERRVSSRMGQDNTTTFSLFGDEITQETFLRSIYNRLKRKEPITNDEIVTEREDLIKHEEIDDKFEFSDDDDSDDDNNNNDIYDKFWIKSLDERICRSIRYTTKDAVFDKVIFSEDEIMNSNFKWLEMALFKFSPRQILPLFQRVCVEEKRWNVEAIDELLCDKVNAMDPFLLSLKELSYHEAMVFMFICRRIKTIGDSGFTARDIHEDMRAYGSDKITERFSKVLTVSKVLSNIFIKVQGIFKRDPDTKRETRHIFDRFAVDTEYCAHINPNLIGEQIKKRELFRPNFVVNRGDYQMFNHCFG